MTTRMMNELRLIALAAATMCSLQAQAFTFGDGTLQGSFDSNITLGTGVRTRSPDASLLVSGATGSGAPGGDLALSAGLGDQGDLNYAKGDAFTTYLKGNHELLLKLPDEQITFMARANWLRDWSATDVTNIIGADTAAVGQTTGLTPDAASDLRFKARLLDFWVSKSFSVGDEQVRVRVGNQVISWGESLFLPGGINSSNAMDLMRLAQPGTQLKEVYLPAPMVSVASGLGHGLNVEGYVQTDWNADYFPPVGSFWSTSQALGKGGLPQNHPSNNGQWGLALRYQPEGTQMNLGVYAMNYHDKAPQLHIDPASGNASLDYLENRQLYGLSANMPLGDWALGTELSYRPRDAVSLNPAIDGCASLAGNCWVDSRRWQWHLTGLYSMTPSNAKGALDFLHADTATLLAEAVLIRYPGLKQQYGQEIVSSGIYGWGQETNPNATPMAMGTATSSGWNFDFSWVYDGTLIPGWQVQPEVYYFQALSGRTPNASALFMSGAKSANFVVTFMQNPTNWQVALNYTHFWGGSSVFDQPLRDRDFVGVYVQRNF